MRNLVFTFIFLALALTLLTFFVGVKKVEPKSKISHAQPHLYGNESFSLKNIHLTVFYVVPKDVIDKKDENWKESLTKHLENLLNFHAVQFENTSHITYEYFPQIIIGEKTVTEYESLLGHNDHDALLPLQEELRRRVFAKGGDLSSLFTIKSTKDTRNVYLVLFEGNGAAGNDDFSLISRSYITNPLYQETASTFLAHEFYHTLGLPDNYQTAMYGFKDGQQVDMSILTNRDIMGFVNIPLQHTYIDRVTLKKMGL